MLQDASVQATLVQLEAIEDGVVRLPGGHCRAVLEVAGAALDRERPGELEALLAGYGACLNSLDFPVQLLVRVEPANLEPRLMELERRARDELDEPLDGLARDHVAFVRRLPYTCTLLERRCYVVVPAEPPAERRPLFLFGGSVPGEEDRLGHFALAREQLEERCQALAQEFGRCGLSARRLTTTELVRLYQACWCPELSRARPLRGLPQDWLAPVVRGTCDGGSS